MTKDENRITVFDTTLRDGEQSAGASMRPEDKLEIALQLERLGVDVIEAGFPVSSAGEMKAVKAIAREVSGCVVCALARAGDKDVDAAIEAVSEAGRPRVHTFIATSPIHMEKKLGLAPDEVVERARAAVRRARNKVEDVEFSAEDAGRSERDFLCRIVEAAIDEGATTINVPDTVGYTMPEEFASIVADLIERVPNSDKAVFSVHCHDDLGMAVANSLAAVGAGARQVECTINGIGERAGNASLEEIVMALRTRRDLFGLETGIDHAQLVPTSRMVSAKTGMAVQPNKAVVGENAFAHESGIHQDGVFKDRATYEIMRAEDVGWESNRITLGKLSGTSGVRHRLEKLGHCLDKAKLKAVCAAYKKLTDKKKNITDEELEGLVREQS